MWLTIRVGKQQEGDGGLRVSVCQWDGGGVWGGGQQGGKVTHTRGKSVCVHGVGGCITQTQHVRVRGLAAEALGRHGVLDGRLHIAAIAGVGGGRAIQQLLLRPVRRPWGRGGDKGGTTVVGVAALATRRTTTRAGAGGGVGWGGSH